MTCFNLKKCHLQCRETDWLLILCHSDWINSFSSRSELLILLFQAEISVLLESLRKKFKTLSKTKEQWEETKKYIQVKVSPVIVSIMTHFWEKTDLSARHISIPFVYCFSSLQAQAAQTEKEMKEEFAKLHQFLQREENTRLKALKREEEIKNQVMTEKLKNIKDQINTLSSTISDIETALKAKELPFLQVLYQPMFTLRLVTAALWLQTTHLFNEHFTELCGDRRGKPSKGGQTFKSMSNSRGTNLKLTKVYQEYKDNNTSNISNIICKYF